MSASSWEPLFRQFIAHLTIDSKEKGPCKLVLNGAQERFLSEVCEGLDRGIRHFVCLKARQLGISTISLAMDMFWLYMHPGLQGSLITDDEGNRDKFRILLERYIASLPRGLRINSTKHNRKNLVLRNGSVLDYLVAGVKKSGRLGRSRALNFVHATECSSWGDPEGTSSLMSSLAENNPDRLYIFESTARGFNLFYDMWEQAGEDHIRQKRIFIGWWSKEEYAFPRRSQEFKAYWDGTLTDEEMEMIATVKEKYHYTITPEQIAWYRWKSQTQILDMNTMKQEFPSTEDEAFVMTGQSFFPLRRITDDVKQIRETKVPLKAYRYHMGQDFMATEIEQLTRTVDADLRVWEEPKDYATYVIGVDVAYGRSDTNDRHAIEVYRCFADRLVQVAEYCTSQPETYQCAWVLAHLAGSYRNCIINLEVTGPGITIMQELKHLRQLLDSGMLTKGDNSREFEAIFSAVRWYLYHRPDSMGAGYVYGWKTNQDNKLTILNQMRDNYALRLLRIFSIPLLEEMKKVVQEGSVIEAAGRSHDDRVMGTAFAEKAWIEWVRPSMIANNETYDTVMKLENQRNENPGVTFHAMVVKDFFQRAQDAREEREWSYYGDR